MRNLNKVTVAWDGLLANLCRAIGKWEPEDFPRERDYRDSLAAHLRVLRRMRVSSASTDTSAQLLTSALNGMVLSAPSAF